VIEGTGLEKERPDLCAIDSGQTDIRFIFHDRGREVARGETGEGITNLLLPGALRSLKRSLAKIATRAVDVFGRSDFSIVSAGLTGISREREEYRVAVDAFRAVFKSSSAIIHNDISTTHAANFRGMAGIILHAGTGAFAFGMDPKGRSMRTGGWGYLLGDEGAGFGIGLAGIRAAIRACEGTGEDTALKEELLPAMGTRRLDQLKSVVYNRSFQRKQIADFSRAVFDRAEQGDPVARGIVAQGVRDMVNLITPIVENLDFASFPVVLTGALYGRVNSYFECTKEAIVERYGQGVNVGRGTGSTLDGALWIGLEALKEGEGGDPYGSR